MHIQRTFNEVDTRWQIQELATTENDRRVLVIENNTDRPNWNVHSCRAIKDRNDVKFLIRRYVEWYYKSKVYLNNAMIQIVAIGLGNSVSFFAQHLPALEKVDAILSPLMRRDLGGG